MVSFFVAMVWPFFCAVIVTCHNPPEPRSALPSYIPAPFSVVFVVVFIAAIPMSRMAGIKNVTVTAAPVIGCPVASVNLTSTVLVPFCAGEGTVVSVALTFSELGRVSPVRMPRMDELPLRLLRIK